MTLSVKTFVVHPLKNNNYIVMDSASQEAIMIDCSWAAQEVMEYLENEQIKLKYILLTHGHFDHVMGVNTFRDTYHVPVYMSDQDTYLLKHINEYAGFVGLKNVPEPHISGVLEKNNALTIGQNAVQIIKTPGHTPGGVCFLIDKYLFSGDTLFQGSYGRTDFPGGDEATIQASLHYLFDKLSDDIVVYPGHGAQTTIGAERKLYK